MLYAFERKGRRNDVAVNLLSAGGVVAVQCLNEFATVALRKFKRPWDTVLQALQNIRVLCPDSMPMTIETLLLAAALEASCGVFYSEDWPDGQVIEGITIRNPFTKFQ